MSEHSNRPSFQFYIQIILFSFIFLLLGLVLYSIFHLNAHIQSIQNNCYQNIQKILTDQQQFMKHNRQMIQKIVRSPQKGADCLLLAEVHTLVQMASVSLSVRQDRSIALYLLEKAKERLQTFSFRSPQYAHLFQMIHQKILELAQTTPPHEIEIYSRLETINQQIESLPHFSKPIPHSLSSPTTSNIPSSTVVSSKWKKFLQSSWEAIRQFLIVHRWNEDESSFLLLQHEPLLRLNLHLLISQAESALFQGQKDIYSSSLLKMEHILNVYSLLNQIEIQKITQEIQDVRQIDLTPSLLNLDDILQYLQHIQGQLCLNV